MAEGEVRIKSYVSDVENALKGNNRFKLQSEWKTENGVPLDYFIAEQRPATYRCITGGNSTYGFVPVAGPVKLKLRFIPVSSVGDKQFADAIRDYTELSILLSKSQIPQEVDEGLERAICDAAGILDSTRN